jgi:HlyD family secretion protein
MNRKALMIVIALGVGALAASYVAASPKKERAANPPAVAAPADPRSPVGAIVAAGRVEPASEEINLGPQMDGVLAGVAVEEGQQVRRGQVIATLDNRDYGARVELARAAVAEREAALARLRNGSRVEEKREADAQVREARASLDLAASERDRRQALLDRGAVSRSEFDLAERDWRTAKARLEAVEQRTAVVYQPTRSEDLDRAVAELATARARLAEAQAMLEKTIIRAPIDGRVLRKIRKAGESVSANGQTPIVSLGDCSKLHVRADVDEIDVAQLRIGMPAWVRADAYGDRKFTGRVVKIGQALGRKNVRTDEPSERVDRKILETLVELDPGQDLPVGLRVDTYLTK